mmetsp:Transcript_11356/g.19038  ORF Transcript_11356/g.19038 Transcript_11356/m.19038 type:complete len:113 (-) Transcript_11356:302-640(-)
MKTLEWSASKRLLDSTAFPSCENTAISRGEGTKRMRTTVERSNVCSYPANTAIAASVPVMLEDGSGLVYCRSVSRCGVLFDEEGRVLQPVCQNGAGLVYRVLHVSLDELFGH